MSVAAVLLGASLALAQDPKTSDENLAAQATDPTAALMSFQLYDWYTPTYRDVDGSTNQIVFRAAIPFSMFGTQHIFRVTQPYLTSSVLGPSGFADTTVFDLMTFNQPWGRWGVGISGTLPTGGNGLSSEKWTAGPAAGFVDSSAKAFNWGLFAQTFFSFAGKDSASSVGVINLQPIFSYQLGQGRSLSLGNSALIYDTTRSRWSSLMLGVNYGQVMGFAGQKWRPNVELDYDFRNSAGVPTWIVRAGVALLLPTF